MSTYTGNGGDSNDLMSLYNTYIHIYIYICLFIYTDLISTRVHYLFVSEEAETPKAQPLVCFKKKDGLILTHVFQSLNFNLWIFIRGDS